MKIIRLPSRLFSLLVMGLIANSISVSAHSDVDIPAAEGLLKSSRCSTCHSVDKQKTGPSFIKTAEKYKDNPDAEVLLVTHITTGPMVEIDGKKEAHAKVKSSDNVAIKNLVQFILTR